MKTVKTSKSRNPNPRPPIPSHRYDPLYLAFFVCFNAQKFFEAHEVLEELWRETPRSPQSRTGFKPVAGSRDRQDACPTTNWHFYKGLIQLAVGFVHLQKGNLVGASALLRRAQENLCPYGVRRFIAALPSGDSSPKSTTLGAINRAAQSADKSAHSKIHEGLDLTTLLAMIEQWRTAVKTAQASGGKNPFSPNDAPKLVLKGVKI